MVKVDAATAGAVTSKVRPVLRANSSRVAGQPGGRGGSSASKAGDRLRAAGCRVSISASSACCLFGRGHRLHRRLTIAAQRIDIALATERFRSRVDLIAVIQVQRHQRFLDAGQRPAAPDRVLAEARQRRLAHGHHAAQFGGVVAPVVPEADIGMGGAGGSRIFIGEKADALRLSLAQDAGERCGFIAAGREFAIAVVDRDLVPDADFRGVGIAQIDPCHRP